MGLIVDRIVNIDAPVTNLAEQISVDMLDARRAERSYFLLRDQEYLKDNQVALARLRETAVKIQKSFPEYTTSYGSSLAECQALRATVRQSGFLARAPGVRRWNVFSRSCKLMKQISMIF